MKLQKSHYMFITVLVVFSLTACDGFGTINDTVGRGVLVYFNRNEQAVQGKSARSTDPAIIEFFVTRLMINNDEYVVDGRTDGGYIFLVASGGGTVNNQGWFDVEGLNRTKAINEAGRGYRSSRIELLITAIRLDDQMFSARSWGWQTLIPVLPGEDIRGIPPEGFSNHGFSIYAFAPGAEEIYSVGMAPDGGEWLSMDRIDDLLSVSAVIVRVDNSVLLNPDGTLNVIDGWRAFSFDIHLDH